VRTLTRFGAPLLALWAIVTAACGSGADGVANSNPVHLVRPAVVPLTAMAAIGRAIFYDTNLSRSGQVSCASCHQADNAYAAAANASAAQVEPDGGPAFLRAIPSLGYVYRTPNFSIGPMPGDEDDAALGVTVRTAGNPETLDVPHGGLFWDGRVNTLQDQAMGPLFNRAEMGNSDMAAVSDKLRKASYAPQLQALFGADALASPDRLVDEAMFAVARYQIEDRSFHPYSSKYDDYLEGKASLTATEARGLRAFDDKNRGNCAACHVDRPGSDGSPPAFTDYEYEALGVPRNNAAIRDGTFDLGVCGPSRTDLAAETRYCGMFRTPSLRNVATRSAFFHNGVYRTLEDVLKFYNFRDTRPESIYPTAAAGGVLKFNDLPAQYHANIDIADPPFNRKPGEPAPMTEQDMRDIIAFLRTLTDSK
jgi:cytochrome c peroxidase